MNTTEAKDLTRGTFILAAERPTGSLKLREVEKVTTDEVSGYSLIWCTDAVILPRPSSAPIMTPTTEEDWEAVASKVA